MARIAKSLATLRSQINEKYPNRNKISDGWIGDQAHKAVKSDHNPNAAGVVCALDITHDPGRGVHGSQLAETLKNDPRVAYVIWNRKIWDRKWLPYNGKNPHDRHVHVSVKQTPSVYDNGNKWDLGGEMALSPQEENEVYQIVLERPMEHGGTGRTALQVVRDAKGELAQKRTHQAKLVADLQTALKNEQGKPPKEVVKEVTKIVEVAKPVDPDSVVLSKDSLWSWVKNLPIFKK